MTQTKPIRRIAIIGTGVIGASWTALFLAKGLQVVATDIAPNAEAALRKFVETAWPALKRLGLVTRSVAVEPEVHGRPRAGARRRRSRPGERARADRFQAEALWPAGRAAAARRDHRLELVGAHHERNPEGRRVPSRALRHRPSVQSAALDPAGRDRRRGKDLGSDNPARSGILHVDRAADGARQQGDAGPCRQPPAGRVGARGLLPRRRGCGERRRRRHRPVLGPGPALGRYGQHDAQPSRRRSGRHRALLPAVHRPDDGLVEDPRLAGANSGSAKEAHRQRPCRGRIAHHRASWRRSATKSCSA